MSMIKIKQALSDIVTADNLKSGRLDAELELLRLLREKGAAGARAVYSAIEFAEAELAVPNEYSHSDRAKRVAAYAHRESALAEYKVTKKAIHGEKVSA